MLGLKMDTSEGERIVKSWLSLAAAREGGSKYEDSKLLENKLREQKNSKRMMET